MDQSTIHQLNAHNHSFYTEHAESFSQTRTSAWQGWTELLPLLKHIFEQNHAKGADSPTTVLDLGCGNGRFLSFLLEHFSTYSCEYHGIDVSQTLLEKAQALALLPTFKRTLDQQDFVEQLLAEKTPSPEKHYDIVCLFGVLHHIPSNVLREQLLKWAVAQVKDGGVLIATFWQFGLDQEHQRADNDYLLSWQNQPNKRYAHHFDQAEIAEVLQKLSNTQVLAQFNADGKKQRNHYIVLKKNNDGV